MAKQGKAFVPLTRITNKNIRQAIYSHPNGLAVIFKAKTGKEIRGSSRTELIEFWNNYHRKKP